MNKRMRNIISVGIDILFFIFSVVALLPMIGAMFSLFLTICRAIYFDRMVEPPVIGHHIVVLICTFLTGLVGVLSANGIKRQISETFNIY